ncbi:MAG: hypothetical protein F7B60_07195 [Desulfurococcales archaeon]|nr:hypothetical protein [Desulfurococcales archaeon]
MKSVNINSILSKHFSTSKREMYFLEANNGNAEVLIRRAIIEKIEDVNLSSVASGIIDFEVIPQDIRRGIIGTLQIPLIVVGPFHYRVGGNNKKTYIPLAYVTSMISNIAMKLAEAKYDSEKMNIENISTGDLLQYAINLPAFKIFLFSFAIASALKVERIIVCMNGSNVHCISQGIQELLEVDDVLFKINPTILDIAKIITSKENPQLYCYEKKLRETMIFALKLTRAMPHLFQ